VGRAPSAEAELALLLCGTEARRTESIETIDRLAGVVDFDALLGFLVSHRILALVGVRLEHLFPERVPERFGARVRERVDFNRHRGLLVSHVTSTTCKALEAAGIPALPLKGTLLAEHAHGDVGLREAPSDIDLLVEGNLMDEARSALESQGWHTYDGIDWGAGLPHYHWRLSIDTPVPLGLELHWRIHWYETSLTDEMLKHSIRGEDGGRQLSPIDELVSLLLVYVRDGYVGLRIAADIAAWWDRNGDALPSHALDPVMDAHPPLRNALLGALAVAERTVGLPRTRLVSPSWHESRRASLGMRLANWCALGDEEEVATNITLNDLLLTPRGGYGVFLRHYYLQPVEKYRLEYGWAQEQRVRNKARRLVRAGVRICKSGWKYQRTLWALRGGREWAPLP
jgi:hypothetical protein